MDYPKFIVSSQKEDPNKKKGANEAQICSLYKEAMMASMYFEKQQVRLSDIDASPYASPRYKE